MEKEYRIKKVLNHNAVIALLPEEQKEYLLLGKGVGFGKKVAERITQKEGMTVYSLQQAGDRGSAEEIVKSVSPDLLEVANAVLDEAEKQFGKVDRSILFPMADHLDFAVRRIKNHEVISNPLTQDIRVMFHMEYKAAETAVPLLLEKTGETIPEDEIGFLALHVHSAIVDENVAQSLKTAQIVRSCLSMIEEKSGEHFEVMSLGYNRMMNHIRYMVTRILTGEPLKMNLNDYMETHYPSSFGIAKTVCNEVGKTLKKDYQPAEIGYLAMHIERVIGNEEV